jgi:uncharacterized repeat protein (TIGR01451 family)
LRSLNGVDDPTDGPRVRAKRRAQAEFLANLIQARQVADPNERIVVIGDYNAFQFNDGYVDMVGTVRGTPTPAANVVLASSDLVTPDLVDAADSVPAAQHYSYVFGGSAQTLDQMLFTQNLQPSFVTLEHGRVNADFPEVYRNDPNRPERLSDHDPAVAYFRFPKADLWLSITSAPAPITGQDVTYTLAVTNTLTDAAASVVLSTTVPAGLATFTSITAPAGWTCTTPTAGNAGAVQCTNPSLAAGASESVLLKVTIACPVANGTSLALSATISSTTFDPDLTNNSRTATTSVSNPPPSVNNVTVDQPELWPPNLKMVDIQVGYSATDTCGAVTCVLSVSSSEPQSGKDPDFEVVTSNLVRVRADRDGNGPGRIYTITVTCTDTAGNSTAKTATVTVPHSNKQ